MPWLDSYSTGFDEIDRDHRRLVDIFDRFVAALNRRIDAYIIDVILTEFITAISEHYVYEYNLMKEINYIDIDAHTSDHDRAMAAMSKVISEFHAGRYQAANEMVSLINKWELLHIQHHDRPLAKSAAAFFGK